MSEFWNLLNKWETPFGLLGDLTGNQLLQLMPLAKAAGNLALDDRQNAAFYTRLAIISGERTIRDAMTTDEVDRIWQEIIAPPQKEAA